MTERQSAATLELLVYGAILFAAVAIFWATLDLPASRREPLGSSSIPQAVSAIVGVFCLILMIRSVRVLRAGGAPASPPEKGDNSYRRRYDLALGGFVLAIVFAFLIQARWVPAEILTPVFLGTGMLMLNGFRRRAILPSLVIAVVVGLATTYAFKNFFYIDLP